MIMTPSTWTWLVSRVLDGLAFPARHWQLVAQAELYGVDAGLHERLRQLPDRHYADPDEVAAWLRGAVEGTDRPVVPAPRPRPEPVGAGLPQLYGARPVGRPPVPIGARSPVSRAG
jgi:Protein of unknown function (DUF2795)